jgi:hypothetical protein
VDDIHYRRRAEEGISEAEIRRLLKLDLSNPKMEQFSHFNHTPMISKRSSIQNMSSKMPKTASSKNVRFSNQGSSKM